MPRTRQAALAVVAANDIIHGSIVDGPSLILLVVEVTARHILCRRVTTGQAMRFDRETGALNGPRDGRIDSIEPLPPAIHDVLLHLDRVHRLSDVDRTPERLRLTDEQLAALRFTHNFYPENPIVEHGA